MLAIKQNMPQESHRQSQVQTPHVTRPNRAGKNASLLWERASVLGCIMACAMVLWMVAANGGRIAAMNYSIDKMQAQAQKVSAEDASLTAQVDSLQKPERILHVALSELHMQYATPVQIQAANQSKH